ncbi:dipeptide epimerase [Roseateles violae]|uniref:Dipeptide epimerase n=1 Tax=Roseateles violae TaxID=3058042 RepID=A0ABT8DY45_9BURK|nr:dipeptide epimerase [Pelomonas sp. PFR6]MDN3922127.1 dipeptide epimerase [Pelomonas sp. PFR6]
MSLPLPLSLDYRLHDLTLAKPFHISGYTFRDVPVLDVSLRAGGLLGRGEAAGVYYSGDLPANMPAQLEAARPHIEAGLSRQALRELLPAGGARNALDCALWDLEARRAGCAVWQLAGLRRPQPLLTTMTLSADAPAEMAAGAQRFAGARALKLKLTGETELDIERVRAVRAARPEVWLSVDANQGFTPATIERLLPVLADCRVMVLEQPFSRGREQDMKLIDAPCETAADESCLSLAELERIAGLFDIVNIKLDKCGGLTEGLMIAERARALGIKVMVGCMPGTGLAMAPAFVLGQLCDVVDLDAPLAISNDCRPTVRYEDGRIDSPAELWGGQAA